MPPNKKIKIIVADDHHVVRAGLKTLLQFESDFEVVAEAKNIHSVYEALRLNEDADVLIIDLKWHENTHAGIDLIKNIRSKQEVNSPLRIVVISNYSHLLSEAENAGADIALTKNFEGDYLVAKIRDAVHNPANLPHFSVAPRTDPLTSREKEILQLIQRGLSDKIIATQLNISEQTVKNHNKNMFDKLNASNRQEAVTRGLLSGIIQLQDTATHS